MQQQKYQVFNHSNAQSSEIDKKDQEQQIYKQTSGIYNQTEIQHGEFNLDSQEYQQVFKVFDKENTGEITIQQVYDLINKFEDSANQQFSNLNLDKTANNNVNSSSQNQGKTTGQARREAHGLGTKSYAQNSSSIYSNGGSNFNKQDSNAGKAQGSNTYHHSRTTQKQNTGNGYGQDNSKFSPSRKHTMQTNHNGGQGQASGGLQGGAQGGGGNIMQLHPTQLQHNQNNTNKYTDNNNRSPRRPKETGGHLNHGGGKNKESFKMNGSNNNTNNNPNQENSGSDKSNELEDQENNEFGQGGIIQKNSKLKNASGGGGESGSSNNLLQQNIIAQGNSQQMTNSSTPTVMEFPNGKETLKFEEFVDVIRDSCKEPQTAENYLVLAFSMFDRQKKGYISTGDLQEVFELLGESITDDEVNTMIKIAGIKSSDKINFKEFVDFFYKID